MKILIVSPLGEARSGGPAQYAQGLMHGLSDDGHDVKVITFDSVHTFPTGIRHVLFFIKTLRSLKGIDQMIVLDTVSVALPALTAALLLRKKAILRIGGDFLWETYVARTKKKIPLSLFYKTEPYLSVKEYVILWMQKYYILKCAHLLVFSTEWQRTLWHEPYALRMTHTACIQNAFSGFTQSVTDVQKTHSQKIVWIGRDIFLKNAAVLDRAITIVRRTYPNIEYELYTNRAHKDIHSILASSRMLVLPSFSEVSPNLALEALALGVPVLLTKDCGFNGVIQHGITWIDPNSEHDIANHIMKLMDDTYYENIQASIRHIPSHTYRNIAQEFMKLFSRL